MAAAALAAGADPSWFPHFASGMGGGSLSSGGGGGGGLPSLDHALQTVAASRSQHWAQASVSQGCTDISPDVAWAACNLLTLHRTVIHLQG